MNIKTLQPTVLPPLRYSKRRLSLGVMFLMGAVEAARFNVYWYLSLVAFTEEEAREMRLNDYLELKREFGAEHG